MGTDSVQEVMVQTSCSRVPRCARFRRRGDDGCARSPRLFFGSRRQWPQASQSADPQGPARGATERNWEGYLVSGREYWGLRPHKVHVSNFAPGGVSETIGKRYVFDRIHDSGPGKVLLVSLQLRGRLSGAPRSDFGRFAERFGDQK